MTLSQLSDKLQSVEKVIQFCQEKKMMGKIKIYRTCQHPCHLKKMRKSHAWTCRNTKCRTWTALREGTFFSRSKLAIAQILKLIYLWSHEMAIVTNIRRECGINSHSFCRHIPILSVIGPETLVKVRLNRGNIDA